MVQDIKDTPIMGPMLEIFVVHSTPGKVLKKWKWNGIFFPNPTTVLSERWHLSTLVKHSNANEWLQIQS